ncbi:MAG: hypothetical protein AM324_011600 [Candidatus Thorarchaeota archaeon SMTZ1-83]
MSDDIPERSAIIRSTIITVILTVVLLSLGLAFWAWSAPEVIGTSPVGALNDMNPFLVLIIEILVMSGVFIFLTITVINIRLFLTQIRAGWTEIILLLIVTFVMTFLMFDSGVAIVTLLLSLAFIVYLYMLQE